MNEEHREAQLRLLEDYMARLQRAMHLQASGSACGLTVTQTFILRYLDKHGSAKASDIAKMAGLSPGAVTQVCDELVRMGFVDRTRSNDDRRVVHIDITDAGRSELETVKRSRSERMLNLFTGLGAEDTDAFVRIIGRVVEMVEENRTNDHKGEGLHE